MQYNYDIKFGMLHVHENEISLRKWSGCIAHLRILEGTLPAVLYANEFSFSEPGSCIQQPADRCQKSLKETGTWYRDFKISRSKSAAVLFTNKRKSVLRLYDNIFLIRKN